MIEFHCVPRGEAAHEIGDGSIAGLEKEMEVIRDKYPSKATSRGLLQDMFKTQQKPVTVGVIEEDLSPLDTTTDDVMACTRSVYAGLSRHGKKVATPLLH